MPLWLHCIIILKLKMEPYWTLITLYICSAQSRNRYNSRIVLRKVGILTLLRKVGILTLRKTILELLLRKVGIGTKWEYILLSKVGIGTKLEYRILQFISSRCFWCTSDLRCLTAST